MTGQENIEMFIAANFGVQPVIENRTNLQRRNTFAYWLLVWPGIIWHSDGENDILWEEDYIASRWFMQRKFPVP